jgi:uncharacterized protein (TIGR03435 family)
MWEPRAFALRRAGSGFACPLDWLGRPAQHADMASASSAAGSVNIRPDCARGRSAVVFVTLRGHQHGDHGCRRSITLTHRQFFIVVVVMTSGIAGVPNARPLMGQTAAPVTSMKTVAFEVASIKTTSSGAFAISPYGLERFSIRSASLTLLISLAYGVSDAQILGGADWRSSEYYDVTAKADDGVTLTYDELRPRLQELLARRFKLATHRELKPLPGYALVAASGGPRLKISKTESPTLGSIVANGLRAPSISMDSFAAMLAGPVGRPVINETGLSGNYEIALSYAPAAVADSPLPSIFTALQEQLGLKLESRTVPVESIVIDRVERPTED